MVCMEIWCGSFALCQTGYCWILHLLSHRTTCHPHNATGTDGVSSGRLQCPWWRPCVQPQNWMRPTRRPLPGSWWWLLFRFVRLWLHLSTFCDPCSLCLSIYLLQTVACSQPLAMICLGILHMEWRKGDSDDRTVKWGQIQLELMSWQFCDGICRHWEIKKNKVLSVRSRIHHHAIRDIEL